MLITADAANPFDDAELYRISHLVRTHGAGIPVEAAAVGSVEALQEAVQRLRLLGSTHTYVVPAGFRRAPTVYSDPVPYGTGDFSGVEFYGPLMSEKAVLRIIGERVRDTLHALSHGRTGVEPVSRPTTATVTPTRTPLRSRAGTPIRMAPGWLPAIRTAIPPRSVGSDRAPAAQPLAAPCALGKDTS